MRDITFIADLGSNWQDQDDILDAIPEVAASGADIFKLQWFNHRSLYGLYGGDSKPPVDLETVAIACQDAKIELMVSVFNERDVPFIDRYVNRHKIASAEASHPVLLNTVIATGKPIILSVGCIDEPTLEIVARRMPTDRTTYLYCCAEYPARNVNLASMLDISNITKCPVGYSDHGLDIWQTALFAARYYNAKIIEKHVYHRQMYTPDAGHSISCAEFRRLVDIVKEDQQPDRIQAKWFVRRPIAIQHIEPWQKLEYGKNWGFYRPKDDINLPPVDNFAWMANYSANVMIAQHEIKAGHAIFGHNVRLVPRS